MNTPENNQSIAASSASSTGFGRRLRRAALVLLALAACAALAASSVVIVDETEYVIVARLGDIDRGVVYDRPEDRGLHFKLPWPIDTVRRFDRRVQLFDPPGREMHTRDRKNIVVDAYVCWKIADPPAGEEPVAAADRPVVRFYRSLGDMDVARSRLDSRIRPVLNSQIGSFELSELLSVTDSEAGPDENRTGVLARLAEAVRRQALQRANESESLATRLGIEIVDVRIKRINLPAGNQQAVFERMKSERKKFADVYRSTGMSKNKVIRSRADLRYEEILARARADAERIRGEAEAESLSVLNSAHQEDPEFYRFNRTLDAYRKILNEKTTLVLSSSSNLLKLLTEGVGGGAGSAEPEERSSVERGSDDGG